MNHFESFVLNSSQELHSACCRHNTVIRHKMGDPIHLRQAKRAHGYFNARNLGIHPSVYEEDDDDDDVKDEVNQDGEDAVNNPSDINLESLDTESFEDHLIDLMRQEAEARSLKPVVVPVVKPASFSRLTPGVSLLKPDTQNPVAKSVVAPPQDTVESDMTSDTASDLAPDSIRQQDQARQKAETNHETYRPSSHYVSIPGKRKRKIVVKQEPGVKVGPVPSELDVKPVIKHQQAKIVNPNIIDLTMSVNSNPELANLLTSFEEESSNNSLLVDWPSPIYIEDYKLLNEGQWLSTHMVDFYLQHLYYELPSNQQAEVFVFETTFFSVLTSMGLGAVSSYFQNTNFFDKAKIN